MIRSNNGDYTHKYGNEYHQNGSVFRRIGGGIFGSDSSHAADHGNTVFKNSNAIHVMGNELRTSTGVVYRLEGTTLYCSNGQRWYGVSSMAEAKAIVSRYL